MRQVGGLGWLVAELNKGAKFAMLMRQIPCYFPANSLGNLESPVFMRLP